MGGFAMRQPRLLSIGIFAISALVAIACARDGASTASAIEPSELASRIGSDDAPVILDVRTSEEYAAGHIPGSINVPLDDLPGGVADLQLSSDEEIVVHCQRGGRAAKAEAELRDAGYTNLRDLTGHMEGWRSGGYPVE